jgi:hypothetical protein
MKVSYKARYDLVQRAPSIVGLAILAIISGFALANLHNPANINEASTFFYIGTVGMFAMFVGFISALILDSFFGEYHD